MHASNNGIVAYAVTNPPMSAVPSTSGDALVAALASATSVMLGAGEVSWPWHEGAVQEEQL